MAQLLPGDNLQAYIPGDRVRALALGEELPALGSGAALLADISGFTAFTEALARELGSRRGAEQLSATLERVVGELIGSLHDRHGALVYFSGDAITGWLDGDDGSQATACALSMHQVMTRVGELTTPGGQTFRLRLKVAVAVGQVHRFVVGDPDVQLIDVLAGALMDSLAAAETVCLPGEVALDPGAVTSLGGAALLAESRPGVLGQVGIVAAQPDPPPVPAERLPRPALPDAVVRHWVLPQVWERMAAGRGEFLAEIRPAVPVFVRFAGLDFETDPGAPGLLDAFVRRAQVTFDRLGGSVLQLTLGDKGAYLYGVFGSPVAHEDDAVRACEAALDVLELADEVAVRDIQVGVATGRLRSGSYGSTERRTFACLGDAVNLAARLMTSAPVGTVLVHGDVAEATGERFQWEQLPRLQVRGRSASVAIRALRGRATRRRTLASSRGPLVGRTAELGTLRDRWQSAAGGRGQVVVLRAEAGVGKSRLVDELVAGLLARGVTVARGEASPIAAEATYAAWREVWTDLLALGTDPQAADVVEAVARLDGALVGRAPLLGAVLGRSLPDSDLTASFDGELRKTSLEDLLRRLLALRAAEVPLAVVVEDAHWLDPHSRDLVDVLARSVATVPVLLVLTARPDGPAGGELLTSGGPQVTALVLDDLDAATSAELVVRRHRTLTGRHPAPELVATVVERAEGNPFYLEQLVDYLVSKEPGEATPAALAAELPASLHSLVLSRIDAQPEGPRRAVKVASVVGRAFRSAQVAAAYPALGATTSVHQDLLSLAPTGLIELEDLRHGAFAFGHAVTRDVAYDSLQTSVRSLLHGQLGDALEAEPGGPSRHLDLIAYHYSRSENLAQKHRYLRLAADAARAAYAAQAAVSYLEQLLPLVPDDERSTVLLQLAESLEVRGDWSGADAAVSRAREAAETQGDIAGTARARVATAELDRKQGRYAEAETGLAAAEAAFVEVGDDAGRARVLHLRGTLASQQGRHVEARTAYEASMALRDLLGDEVGVAALLTNLALVAEDEGDLDEAERLGSEGLARRRALDDRRAVSVSLTNMGMLATARGDLHRARDRFVEAQALAEEVGDPWVVAVGRHNLGNVTRDLGDLDQAAAHFVVALEAYAEHDDRWSLAHLVEDAVLWLLAGAGPEAGGDAGGHPGEDPGRGADAVALLAAADRLRTDIGAPRSPGGQAALDQALAPERARAASTGSEAALAAADAEGRTASTDVVVDRVRALLDTRP